MASDSPKLLIIEDDRAIARVLERNLQKSGLWVHVAHDGAQAKAALESDQFDFVLCDYQLPDATGEQLCRHIRASVSHATVPIALCTAKAHEVDVDSLMTELGLTDVYFKPFSIRELTAAICEAVASAPAASAG